MIENPTEEQLYKLKYIIYIIYYIHDVSKNYIGQSKRAFFKRYKTKSWWKNVTTRYLKNAIKFHGPKCFKIEILEHGILDQKELDRLERLYSERFNSLAPNGYNLRPCGKSQNPHSQEIIDKLSKTYMVKEISTGKIITFKNLANFCRKNGLTETCLRAVVSKRRRKYKNYTHIDSDLYELKWRPNPKKIHTLQYKNEKPIVVSNLKKFCFEHNLNYDCMQLVLTKKCRHKEQKGWHHPDFKLEDKYKSKLKLYSFLNPNKQKIEILGLEKFCKNNNLSLPKMCDVHNGKSPGYKGWTKA